jgi:hypothetical protein
MLAVTDLVLGNDLGGSPTMASGLVSMGHTATGVLWMLMLAWMDNGGMHIGYTLRVVDLNKFLNVVTATFILYDTSASLERLPIDGGSFVGPNTLLPSSNTGELVGHVGHSGNQGS